MFNITAVEEETESQGAAQDPSGVSGRTSKPSTVSDDEGIQSALTVELPSAQTFINITSQPSENPSAKQRGAVASLQKVRLRKMVWSCVHVNIHLHFIVEDLHKLLHGGQMTRLQLGPHGNVI